MMRIMMLGAAVTVLVGAAWAVPAVNLEVAEAVVATSVVDRAPVNEATEFPGDVGAVYFWTRIIGAEGETTVEHVWYRGDEEAARIQLRVGSGDWRTWSRKTIPADWAGDWRVDVVGPNGEVLESVAFRVG